MIEVKKPFTNNGINFETGHKYVLPEDAEAQFRTTYGNNIGMSYPIDSLLKPYKGEDLSGKKIITFRFGGIGDITFLNPVLRWLKKKYPTCHITAATACKQPLENVPEIDVLLDMPFDVKYLESTDYTCFFQGILESSSEISKKTHAVDMFFSYFGIDSIQLPSEDKVPKLFFNREEMSWLKETLNNLGIKEENYVIGIQVESSSPIRNFPKEKLKAAIDLLSMEDNVRIILIGTEPQEIVCQYYKGQNPNIILATKFTVRQSIVLANRYNMVISPDSFMVQVAGAMEKPLVGLYGPFPSSVRMKYFKNAIGLDPSVVCSPCFKHDFRPCIKGFPSPCFTQVSADDVLQAADYLKFKFTGQHFNYMNRILKEPDLTDIEQYMLSADKGLAFFPRFFKHPNIITVDVNPFTGADVKDLSQPFNREAYPFVIYFDEFQPKYISLYNNSKGFVRPGGYFIAYRENGHEALFNDVKMDIGKNFILLLTKFDPVTKNFIIVGRKPY